MTNFYSAQLYGMVAYHDFEGITVNAEEGPRMLASMGGKPILILRNHGLLAWGETLPQAFAHLWTLQRACEIQVAAKGMGDELIEIPSAVLEQATPSRCSSIPSTAPASTCSTPWSARSIARINPTRPEACRACAFCDRRRRHRRLAGGTLASGGAEVSAAGSWGNAGGVAASA